MTTKTGHRNDWISPLMAASALALAGAGLAACSDEVTEPGPPSPQFNPTPVDFGRVSIVEEKTVELVVSNAGGASPYLVTTVLPPDGADAALFELGPVPSVLTTPPGLPIGQTATISVTFRPCPAAIQDPTDTSACPLNSLTSRISFVDNSPNENNEVTLTGVSTLPPNLGLRCGRVCGDLTNLGQCTTISFGSIRVGESCALPVEITNSDIGDDPVADILVENIDIRVQENVAGVQGATLRGSEAGIEILELDGTPLQPSFGDPLRVAIPRGQTEASYTFQVVFTPSKAATYQGQPAVGNGFRLNFNDPVEPEQLTTLIATGTGPNFQVVNQAPSGNFEFTSGQTLQFRGVTAGETATALLRLNNNGDADMTVGPITLEVMDPEFSIAYRGTAESPGDVVTLEAAGQFFRELEITYAPTDDEPDTNAVLISCSTPTCEPAFVANLAGGALPKLDISPPTVFFQSTAGQEQCSEVTLSNVEGDAQLVIDRFVISGDNPESLDDFFVNTPECGPGVLDCTVDIRISAGAADTVDVCYANGDSSQTDAANLEVQSNDPSAIGGVRSIALIAEDQPCFPPEIDVGIPTTIRVGETSVLDFNPTAEKPGGLGGVGGVLTQCTLQVQFGDPFPFSANPVTAGDSWETAFTPATPGNRIIGVTCLNNCGAEISGQIFFPVSL